MKVALFASAFYPSLGGVEEVVRNLAHQQRIYGGDPLIVTHRWPKSLPAFETIEGLPVRRYALRVPESNIRQFAGAWLFGPSTLRRIVRDIQAQGAEVINVHCVSYNAYYALQVKRILNLPLVVTLHSELTMDANRSFQRSTFMRQLLRTVLTEAEAITACSSDTLVCAEQFLGKSLGQRGTVIYNGVSLEDFSQAQPQAFDRPYIAAFGRLVPQKGFDVLLKALALATTEQAIPHDVVFVGDGTERGNLERLAAELGLERRVRFVGRVDHHEVARIHAGCSFVVLPSRAAEGCPLVVLEAMAAGKAVIASRVGGVPELVDNGKTGLLVPMEDSGQLSRAIIQLAVNPNLNASLGRAAQSMANDFTWEAMHGHYQRIYTEAAVKRKTDCAQRPAVAKGAQLGPTPAEP